jgi:hypothetical protein
MPDHNDNLGGRLPLADPAALTGQQRELFDRMMTTVVPWADVPRNQGASAGIAGWPGTSATGFFGRKTAGISVVSAKPTATTNTTV